MRLFAVLIAMCALCSTANAQAPDCKSIAKTSARLACYDKATPPAASPAAAKPASREAAPASPAYVDKIGAEDALMNARLKNICKGC